MYDSSSNVSYNNKILEVYTIMNETMENDLLVAMHT